MRKARFLTSGEDEIWDDLVGHSTQGNFFQSSAWLKVVNEIQTVRRVGVFEGDDLIGGCSFILRRRMGIVILSNTWFAPYHGMMVRDMEIDHSIDVQAASREVIRAIAEFSLSQAGKVVMINAPEFHDIREFVSMGWKCGVRYTYRSALEDIDTLEKRFRSAARRQINKARKMEIKVVESNDAALFYSLYKKTFQRQEMDVPAREDFFERLLKQIEKDDCGRLFVTVDKEGRSLAGALVTWDEKRGYFAFGGSNPEYWQTGSTLLLHGEIMRYLAKERHLPEYDWVGANTPSLIQFKRNFNPTLHAYYTLEKVRHPLFHAASTISHILKRREHFAVRNSSGKNME